MEAIQLTKKYKIIKKLGYGMIGTVYLVSHVNKNYKNYKNYKNSMNTNIIGGIAGFLTTICLVPQLIAIIYEKNIKSVSLEMYIILLLGQFTWIFFGVLVNQTSVIVTNVVSGFLVCLILLIGFFKPKHNLEEILA